MSTHHLLLDMQTLRTVFNFESEPEIIGFGGESIVLRESESVVKCYYATPDCDLTERRKLISNEIEALLRLEDNSGTLQIPRLFGLDIANEGEVCGILSGDGRAHETFLLGYIRTSEVDGAQISLKALDDADLPDMVAQIGAATAEIHHVLSDAYAAEDPPVSRALDEKVISEIVVSPLVARHADILASAAAAVLKQAYVPVHGDCHAGNMLADENGQLCSVVDWSCVALAPAALDAYKLFSDWHAVDDRASAYIPHYVQAYNQHAAEPMAIQDIFNVGLLYTAGQLASAKMDELPALQEFMEGEFSFLKNLARDYKL